MEKREVKKLVFQAYNLSTEDREVSFTERTTQSLNEWFEEIYNPRDNDETELARILRVVCEVNEVEIAAVKGKRRFQNLITSRREYCYLACVLTQFSVKTPHGNSLSVIGAEIGKDHSTVLHHKKKVANWLQISSYGLQEKFEMIEDKL